MKDNNFTSNNNISQDTTNINGKKSGNIVNQKYNDENGKYSFASDVDDFKYWASDSKSRAVERHAVNELTNNICDMFGVNWKNKQKVKKDVWQIANTAKITGVFTTEQMIGLFNRTFKKGEAEVGNVDDYYKQIKKDIRQYRIKPLEGREYIDFIGKYRNKILFSRDYGQNIDQVYQELNENYPDMFPDDITNQYDQLWKIGEVYDSIKSEKVPLDMYYGNYIEDFKSSAMEQFTYAVDKFVNDINSVSRYQMALADRIQSKNTKQETKVYSLEDIKQARKDAQPIQKKIEKFNRENLLTYNDKSKIEDMLKCKYESEINLMKDELIENNPLGEKIIELYELKKELRRIQAPIFEYNTQRKQKLKEMFLRLISTSDAWKDKSTGAGYWNNTFERNIDDIITDKDSGEKLKDILIRSIHKNVAESTRFKDNYRSRIRQLNIDTKKKYGVEIRVDGETIKGLATEADLIQMYGENLIGKVYLEKIGANVEKIDKIALEFRKIYNELFEKLNEVYIQNGYAPIEYRKDYFPHFLDDKGDTLLNKAAGFLGIDAKNMLPTEIAGRTHEFSPGRQWNSHALKREGNKTDYNVLKGFDNYIELAGNIIYLTEDIQNLRAFENAIRYKYSDKGLQEELDAIDSMNISENEKAEMRNALFSIKDRSTKLNNFVKWVHEYTNILAGKKSKFDRGIEDFFGRGFYTAVKNIENRKY